MSMGGMGGGGGMGGMGGGDAFTGISNAQLLSSQNLAQQVAASRGTTYGGPMGTGSIFSNATPQQIAQAATSQAAATAQVAAQREAAAASTASAAANATANSGVGVTPNAPGEQLANPIDITLAREGAALQSNETIERLREASATERLKYEIDNRIPEIEAKAKGEIDLQKIINEGYKNIKWMERSSNMFSSLMGAFNF